MSSPGSVTPFRGTMAPDGGGGAGMHNTVSAAGSLGEPGTPLGHHGGMQSPFANESAKYNPTGRHMGPGGVPALHPGSHGTLSPQDSSAKDTVDTVHGATSTSEEMASANSHPSSSINSMSTTSTHVRYNSADGANANALANVPGNLPEGSGYTAVVTASDPHRTGSGDTQATETTAAKNDTLDRLVDQMGSLGDAMNTNSSSHGLVHGRVAVESGLGVKKGGGGAQNGKIGPQSGAPGIDGIIFQTAEAGAAVTGQPTIEQAVTTGAASFPVILHTVTCGRNCFFHLQTVGAPDGEKDRPLAIRTALWSLLSSQ